MMLNMECCLQFFKIHIVRPHSMLGISHFGSPTTLTKPQSTCEHWPGSQMYVERSADQLFDFSVRGLEKRRSYRNRWTDTHTSWWQAAANALAMPFVSFFCCVPQAQLRGKGHEKRNWKWIFWQSYFFYLACEKQKTKEMNLRVWFLYW